MTLDSLAQSYSFWKYFFELSAVPRPSQDQELVSQWLLQYIHTWNLHAKRDDYGNISVKVPANRKEFEHAPCIALQAHLDMVCEQDEHAHDFAKDPLDLFITEDKEWVKARGTTLGADDGIGVAYQLSLMDPNCNEPHGPLELLFTLDEEIGLVGASHLGSDMLEARVMINIDNSREGLCCNGCAGGKGLHAELPIARTPAPSELSPYRISLKGLAGGHSGSDIFDMRASAIKLMERVYSEISESVSIKLESFHSGDKHNAIPRSAIIDVYLDSNVLEELTLIIQDIEGILKIELQDQDKEISISIEPREVDSQMIILDASVGMILSLIRLCPHGVISRNEDSSSGTMISNNLATVHSFDHKVEFVNSARFASKSGEAYVQRVIESVFKTVDQACSTHGYYAAWEVEADSKLETLYCESYAKLSGNTAKVQTIHGGLECGIIKSRLEQKLDVISIGPEVESLHSPSERMNIKSCELMWNVLCDMLAKAEELA